MRITFLLSLLCLFVSCNVNKPAEFKAVENLRLESTKNGQLVVVADAKFHNPNHLGGKIKAVNIDVLIDENKLAEMESVKDFAIPKRDEFTIPLRTTIPWEELSKNKGLLGSAIDFAFSKEAEIEMKGNLVLDFKAFDYNYKIEEKKAVKF